MAYTPKHDKTMPIPVEPAVISCYIPNITGSADVLIDIPWDNCKLVHACTTVLTAIDATGDMVLDLELDAAGGSAIGTITIAASAAMGVQDEIGTITSANANNLGRNLSGRDKINVEIDGSAAATGAVMLWLYFENAT